MASKPGKNSLPAKARKALELVARAQKMYLAKRFDVTERLCREAMELFPSLQGVERLLGRALLKQKKAEAALGFLQPLLGPDCDDPHLYSEIGQCLEQLGQEANACEMFIQALAQAEKPLEFRLRLADSLRRRGLLSDAYSYALAALMDARMLDERVAEVHSTVGTILRDMGMVGEALEHFEQSVDADANYAPGCLNAYFCAFELGKLHEAAALAELGFFNGSRLPARKFPCIARWRGEDLSDKTLLIWREQGIGDELYHAALYPWAIANTGKTVIEAAARLESLFQRSFPQAHVKVQASQNDLRRNDADFQTPAGSLPLVVGSSEIVNEIYQAQRQWLIPDAERAAFWKQRFDALGEGLKVGFAWRSGLNSEGRSANYFTIPEAAPILTLPGITFVNMQYGECGDELAQARALGATLHAWDDVDLKNDLDEVAAMMAGLDLVITAGTAVTWLGVGVGTETWTMHPAAPTPLSPPMQLPNEPPHSVQWRKHWTESWSSLLTRASVALAERATQSAA